MLQRVLRFVEPVRFSFNWHGLLQKTMSFLLLLMAFTIPLSTGYSTGCFILLLCAFCCSANWKDRYQQLKQYPLVIAALSICVLLLLGSIYSVADMHQIVVRLKKYDKLLLVPIVIYVASQRNLAQRAFWLFIGTMTAILVSAYLQYYASFNLHQILLHSIHLKIKAGYPHTAQVFNDRITSSILFSFVFYVACIRAYCKPKYRLFFSGLALASLWYLLIMCAGKTGFVLTFFLIGLLLAQLFIRGSRRARWGVSFALIFCVSFMLHSTTFRHLAFSKAHTISQGLMHYHHGEKNTSTGQRLEFYRLSLKAMMDHPGGLHWLFGLGTGSFVLAYEQAYKKDHSAHNLPVMTHNPHNQYLEFLVQLGLLGCGALVFLYYCISRYSSIAFPLSGYFAQGLVLILTVDSCLNTALMDYKTGMFFVFIAALLAGKKSETARFLTGRVLDKSHRDFSSAEIASGMFYLFTASWLHSRQENGDRPLDDKKNDLSDNA
jgi:O-antigen ligase